VSPVCDLVAPDPGNASVEHLARPAARWKGRGKCLHGASTKATVPLADEIPPTRALWLMSGSLLLSSHGSTTTSRPFSGSLSAQPLTVAPPAAGHAVRKETGTLLDRTREIIAVSAAEMTVS